MNILLIAYEKYRLDWMKRHNHTITELIRALDQMQSDLPEESVSDLFDNFDNNYGFDGELWACFDEFMETEFRDDEYMATILTPEELSARSEWILDDNGYYVICYTIGDIVTWEKIYGEELVESRVEELVNAIGCEPGDILVFHTDLNIIGEIHHA